MLRGNEHHRLKNSGQRTWGGSKARDKIACQQSIGRKRVFAHEAPRCTWAGGWHGTTAKQSLQWVSLHWLRVDLKAILEPKPLQGRRQKHCTQQSLHA